MDRRPGGLTALAVFNFIWALPMALSSLGFVFALQRPIPGYEDVSSAWLLTLFAAYLSSAGLLVLSGIGYLGCRPLIGFWGGIAYAFVGLAAGVGWSIAHDTVGVATVQAAMYPVLTLALLLTTFRRDFFPKPAPAASFDAARVLGEPRRTRSSHISLLARFSIRYAMRNGSGVLFLILIVVVGVFAAGSFLEGIEADLRERGTTAEGEVADLLRSPIVRRMIESTVEASPDQVEFLMDRPAVMSGILLILLIMTPYSICLSGFNQTAGDIGTRGLRYLLLRTERRHVFLGRFLGTFLFSAGAMAFLLVVLVLYLRVGLGAYGGDLWIWTGEGYLALLLLALPHLALCAWISGASNGPFIALALSLMATALPVAMIKATIAALELNADVDLVWMEKLLPWGWKYELLSHDIGTRMRASMAMLVFAAAFLSLGDRHFGRRDL